MADLTDMLEEEFKEEKIFKTFEIKQDKVDTDNRTFKAVLTSEVIDKDGEIVKIDGISTKSFKKNAIVLWSHDPFSPIGKCLSFRKSGNSLVAETQLAKDDPLANRIWNLVKQDIIKGISIGFAIKDARYPTKKDLQDFGKSLRRVINKSEIFEYSLVSLPCNEDALISSVNKGLITKEECKKFFNMDLPDKKEQVTLELNLSNKTKRQVTQEIIDNAFKIKMAKKRGSLNIK